MDHFFLFVLNFLILHGCRGDKHNPERNKLGKEKNEYQKIKKNSKDNDG
jgi:hypothetical protein